MYSIDPKCTENFIQTQEPLPFNFYVWTLTEIPNIISLFAQASIMRIICFATAVLTMQSHTLFASERRGSFRQSSTDHHQSSRAHSGDKR